MPYNPDFTPDAPLPISMLPSAEPLSPNDQLLITQLANINGKSRKISIKSLLNSDPFIQAPSGAVSNVLSFSGSLPQCIATYSSYAQMVAVLDVPVIYDVEFRVWGISDTATATTQDTYEYGLTAITSTYWSPYADADIRETHKLYLGKVHVDSYNYNSPVGYSAIFPAPSIPRAPRSAELLAEPTRRVKLYLSSGTSTSPYQGERPSAFDLKVQAICKPVNYAANLLRSSV